MRVLTQFLPLTCMKTNKNGLRGTGRTPLAPPLDLRLKVVKEDMKKN